MLKINLFSALMTRGRGKMLMLLLVISQVAYAQFNPNNPPEPQMYYKCTTSVEPTNAGYSSGNGKYREGTNVSINTSARANYTFLYWTLNGEKYCETPSFIYTMGNGLAKFVAHYAFNPSAPAEPSLNLKDRIFLTCSPGNSCSFNVASGTKYVPDNYVYLQAYANQGYEFKGWYEKGVKINDNLSFNYLLTGTENVTLEARFVYNPTNPLDPVSSGNEPTYLLGDVNKDKLVDVTDAVILNGHYINGTTYELKKVIADVNRDGVVDISDIVATIQTYINE